jgi:SNF2 family DNA or RNA helicase
MSIEWVPHEYQKKAIKFALQSGSCQLWLAPGMGKTAITLQVMKSLRQAEQIKRVLVLAPLRVAQSVWQQEATKWLNFENISIDVLHGAGKEKLFATSESFVNVLNYDGLAWLSHQVRKTGYFPYDMLVVDEISYLKNTRTQRFKALAPLLDKFKRRIGLTGSPAPNGMLDIFGPFLAIDRGATFGRFISHFRTEFFAPSGFGGYSWTLQTGAEEKIYARVEGKAMRLKAEDYLDMPELIYNKVYVHLPEAAQKIYKAVEDKLLAEMEDGTVTASTAAVATMKAQQLANGAVYLDGEEREVKVIHDEKIEAVKELVEGCAGNPVIICYHFKHDLKRLQETFPDAHLIGSGVKGDQLQATIEAWNRKEVSVLLIHPASASHGLNLQAGGNQMIWFSNTWNLEHFEQCVARVYRQGQSKGVVVHQIIAKKTIDEAIVAAVSRKSTTQQGLLDAIKSYASAA